MRELLEDFTHVKFYRHSLYDGVILQGARASTASVTSMAGYRKRLVPRHRPEPAAEVIDAASTLLRWRLSKSSTQPARVVATKEVFARSVWAAANSWERSELLGFLLRSDRLIHDSAHWTTTWDECDCWGMSQDG